MKRTKAQLGIHFHWIFVLIAGAIILTFFVTIVVKQKDISEQRIAGKAVTGLDQIFTAAGVTEDTLNIIEIPKLEIEFFCDKEGYSAYTIRKTSIPDILTPTDIIFSPDLIKGDSLMIWTLAWSMPYRVDNFVMITSPEIRYIITYDEEKDYEASVIFDDIPDQINKEYMSLQELTNIEDMDNYKIKIIYVTSPQSDELSLNLPGWTEKQDISLLIITENYIQFYEPADSWFESDYTVDAFSIRQQFPEDAKDPMVYGAVFAENTEMYACAMKKAFKKLEIISKIYEKRVEYLKNFYESLPQVPDSFYFLCTPWYPESPNELSLIANNAMQCSASYPCESNFERIATKAFEIDEYTNKPLENELCPQIY